jgi:hypothetical protein
LAIGLIANAIIGPLLLDAIHYHGTDLLRDRFAGTDGVALVLAAPMAAVAALFVHRRRPAGPVIAFAPAAFTAHTMAVRVVAPDYTGALGNNQWFAPLHLALFVLAVVTGVTAWHAIGTARLAPNLRSADRTRAYVMIAIAVVAATGGWLPGLLAALHSPPTATSYLAAPTLFWADGLLTVGVVVPGAVAAAIGLRRNTAWARAAAYAVIGWSALVPAANGAGLLVARLNDRPGAGSAATAAAVVIGVWLFLLAVLLLRPVLTDLPPALARMQVRTLDVTSDDEATLDQAVPSGP